VSGVPVELRYFTVWSFRGNKLIRIENFRERGEALEAAGLSEYRPPSVGGLETRWKQRIAATREVAGSKPAAPIVRMAAGAGFFTPLASLLVRNQPRPSSGWPPGLVSSHHSHPYSFETSRAHRSSSWRVGRSPPLGLAGLLALRTLRDQRRAARCLNRRERRRAMRV